MRLFVLSALLSLPASLGCASEIATYTAVCTASDGYTQTWTSTTNGDFNCLDPLSGSTVSFQAYASASIDPGTTSQAQATAFATETTAPGVLWNTVVETVSISDQVEYVASGDTGQARLEGFYAGSIGNLTGAGGGTGSGASSSFGSPGCVATSPAPFTIPFVFGIPFELSVSAMTEYNPGLAANSAFCQITAATIEVVNPQGQQLSGVVFTDPPSTPTPEPLSLLLIGGGLMALGLWTRKRPHR